MQTLTNHTVLRNLIRVIIYFVIVSGLSFFVLAMTFSILGLNGTNSFYQLFILMGLGAFIGGTFWARSVIQAPKSGKIWRAAITSGLAFGIMIFITGYTLDSIEQYLFHRGLLNASGIHSQFVGLFSLAIFLVSGVTSTVTAFQVTNGKQALIYGLITAVVSVVVFIAVDLSMYGLGWRVGHIDFPDRPTMLTVLGIGLGVSMLAGGTIIGVLVERASLLTPNLGRVHK